MKVLSTKQAAELWGISSRRVALLASQGRIPGAVLSGNTWLIPENAKKPPDGRRRQDKPDTGEQEREFFPYIISTVRVGEVLEDWSPEKKALYRTCALYEEGKFQHASKVAGTLLDSNNVNVRLGAEYMLAFACLYQADYVSAEKYSALFQKEYHAISAPTPVVQLLFAASEAEMGNTSEFIRMTGELDPFSFPPEVIPILAGEKLYAELVRFSFGGNLPELTTYEMLCRIAETAGYCYSALFFHLILSLFYAESGDEERESDHLKRAIEIGVNCRYYVTLACMVSVNMEDLKRMLAAFPADVEQQICRIRTAIADNRVEYVGYLRRKSVLSMLSDKDCKLISCCLRGYTITRIAEILGLSRSGTNRRLSALYDKMGVNSMKEMKMIFLGSVFDWQK